MGLCKSCVEKYKQKYMQRGFNKAAATRMALNLLKRVRRRHRYEILSDIKNSFQNMLYRWCFLTQWRATLLASFRSSSVVWIGKGFNPDYTQLCIKAGTGICIDDPTDPCSEGGYRCMKYEVGCTCSCPDPSIAHSHYVSNTCVGYLAAACVCRGRVPEKYCAVVASTGCQCLGNCAYECDSGYKWEGGQCVASAARKSMLGDGSSMIVNNA